MATDATLILNTKLGPQMERQVQRQREMAQRKVERFRDLYDDEMLDFACHVAFPLALTTDVVYLLRQEYFPNLGWSVAAELLLSNLCDVAGYDLYVMDVAVRRILLDRLVEKFLAQRVDELAGWMALYIQHRLAIEPLGRSKVLGHPSNWTALACLKSDDEVTQAIKAELGKLLAETDNPSERFRLSALMESHGDFLVQRGIQPLKLQELIERFAKNQPLDGDEEDVVKIRLALRNAGFPELQTAEIQYAKIAVGAQAQTEETLQTFAFESVRLDAAGNEVFISKDADGRAVDTRQKYQAKYYIETLPDGLNLEMMAIPSGKFIMGSPKSEHERYDDEGPRHEVTVPPFFMGKFAVTQAQWRLVAATPKVDRDLDADPANFKGDARPVEQVSWFDAVEFCARLSRETGRDYRLPTEAEWEYACRAGTTTPFHFGETIAGQVANYNSDVTYRDEKNLKQRGETMPVGSFLPNQFGLYEMHGNVWEWCLDHWHDDYKGAPNDGSAWIEENTEMTSRRVLRGGSWFFNPRDCRSAIRSDYNPDVRDFIIGFRVVCCAPRTLT